MADKPHAAAVRAVASIYAHHDWKDKDMALVVTAEYAPLVEAIHTYLRNPTKGLRATLIVLLGNTEGY